MEGVSHRDLELVLLMKIIILAHGKIKNGPEFDLIFDYATRFNKQFNSDFLTSLEILGQMNPKANFTESFKNFG